MFERLLAKRLNAFTEKNNLFPGLQFGFRKGLGTCDDALFDISNVVQKALVSGCEVKSKLCSILVRPLIVLIMRLILF